jgi:triosephosphate isomerase
MFFYESNGPFTGEVSCEMLVDLNVGIVLVGHSERRHVVGEDDQLVTSKRGQPSMRACGSSSASARPQNSARPAKPRTLSFTS